MAKTAKITLGDQEYTVHAFNLGELERISDLMKDAKPGRIGFEILRLAMERAEPKPEDVGAIEMTLDEVNDASAKLMELAGVKVKKDPPQGQETGEA